jgi:hypothetical protein
MRISFKAPWKRPLPTGQELYKEAKRLGVHFDPSNAGGDAELQRRVLEALVERRKSFVGYVQTTAIITTLILTTGIAVWNTHDLANKESADVMFKFNQIITSGKSWNITKALDLYGNLDKTDVDDDTVEQFLDNYELLAAAYRHGLIDRDMAIDSFAYDLNKALHDQKIKKFLIDSRRQDTTFYSGVLSLARDWNIDISDVVAPATKPSGTVVNR